jgi:hypothetical protein
VSVVVGGADRDDSKADFRRALREQAIGDFMHRAVAACRHHGGKTGTNRLASQFLRMAGLRRRPERGAICPALADFVQSAGGPAPTRMGIEDDAHFLGHAGFLSRRGHGGPRASA